MAIGDIVKIYRFIGEIYQFRYNVPPDGHQVQNAVPVAVATADFKIACLEKDGKRISDAELTDTIRNRFWDIYNVSPVCTDDNKVYVHHIIDPDKDIFFDVSKVKEVGTEKVYRYAYNGEVYINVKGRLYPISYNGMYFEVLVKDRASAIDKIKQIALTTRIHRITKDRTTDTESTLQQMGFTVDDIAINMEHLFSEDDTITIGRRFTLDEINEFKKGEAEND